VSASPRLAAVLLAGAAATIAAAASSTAATPHAGLRITAKPGLFPRFDPGGSDYVSRCKRSTPLTLSIDAPKGEAVSVDGGPARSGKFAATVKLRQGEAVVVAASSSAGTARYSVRCLPKDFPRWSVKRSGPTQAEWYLLTPNAHWVVFFDARGVPVWWKRIADFPFNPTLLPGGTLAWYPLFDGRFGVSAKRTYEEHRLDGSLVRKLATVGPPTDFHELQPLPNGHFLLDAYRRHHGVDLRPFGGPANATVLEAEAQEITPGGKLVWSWSSRGRISLSETGHRWWRPIFDGQRSVPERERTYDAVHINAIAPDGDGLVLSMRHTDALYRIDRATGRIEWKLGGTQTPESLQIVGDPEQGPTTFGGQHDVRVLPDGTITVYDNSTMRKRPPRVLRYRIDTEKRTATLLTRLTDPDVPASAWGGGTRLLPGGDWVTAWGGEPYVTEMTPAGEPVLQLHFPHRNSYRVFPVLPGKLSASTLRAAMDKMHPRRRT
jgi:hypothetical protein